MFYSLGQKAGARLVGGGIGYESKGSASLVSQGINSGPLALRGFEDASDASSRLYSGARMSGFGDVTDTSDTSSSPGASLPSWLTNLISAGTSAVQSAQTIGNAQQINQINIQRAAAGLPPINPTLTGPTVNVGLSQGTQQLLLYGGLAFAGLFLVNMMLKRR